MKKLLSIAIAALATAAVADVVTTGNQVGVTKITTTKQHTVVAVPYTKLADGTAIPVGQLVKAKNLPAGTQLHTYVGGQYSAFERDSDGTGWTAGTGNNEPPSTLSKGSAIWIVLPSAPGENQSQDIYIYGKFDASVPQTVSEGANLLANPLQTSATLTITPVKGDIIQIPNDNGVTDQYMWTQKKSEKDGPSWHRNNVKEAPPAIPAGVGFWYVRKSGGGTADVSWTAAQ